jgi:non-ribosomal peptide synthetase component F
MFELSDWLAGPLKEMSRREGVTLFMLLYAAFNVLLYFGTGKDDITIGTSIANRRHLQVEGLIGCFFNLLPLRTVLSGNPSFRLLLARVRDVTLGAFSHQDVPFERLVEILQRERDPRYSPLFQVLFQFIDSSTRRIELGGLNLSFPALPRTKVKFDLSLSMTQAGGRLSGLFEYNTDLFNAGTIRRMADQFQALLDNIVTDPGKDLKSLSLSTVRERNSIISNFNDPTLL